MQQQFQFEINQLRGQLLRDRLYCPTTGRLRRRRAGLSGLASQWPSRAPHFEAPAARRRLVLSDDNPVYERAHMVTVRFNHEQRVRSTANHRTVNAIFCGERA